MSYEHFLCCNFFKAPSLHRSQWRRPACDLTCWRTYIFGSFYASVDFHEGDKLDNLRCTWTTQTFGHMEGRFRCVIKRILSKLTKIETDKRKCGTLLCRGHVVESSHIWTIIYPVPQVMGLDTDCLRVWQIQTLQFNLTVGGYQERLRMDFRLIYQTQQLTKEQNKI